MDKIIQELRSAYEHLKSNQRLTEDDVKISVVYKIFLEAMGYDTNDCDFERKAGKGFYDMSVKINATDKLIIETKKVDYDIIPQDIDQLCDYIKRFGTEWGILTNGTDFILLNAKIESPHSINATAQMYTIVFKFNIFKSRDKEFTDLKYFKYLHRDYLYNTQKTKFFKDIAQYKAWNFIYNTDSWYNYKSTLYQFFDYYSNYRSKYNDGILSDINIDDFKHFIAYKQEKSTNSKKVTSIDTIKNNYSHISAMINTFKSHNKIGHSGFDNSREYDLSDFQPTSKKKDDISHVNSINIKHIVNLYKEKENANRNIAIFLMCVSIGLERPKIRNLKWTDINLDKNYITIDNRKLSLKPAVSKYLKALLSEQTKEQLKTGYVFTTFFSGKYKPFYETSLNDVFNRIYSYDKNDIWKLYSPAYIRSGLIEELFICNYTLDEIIYITGIDIVNIPRYISLERIVNRQAKGIQKQKPIFDGILDTDL